MTSQTSDQPHDTRNRQLEAHELQTWKGCPDHAVGYYVIPERLNFGQRYSARLLADCTVTTWLGTKIGTLTAVNTYRGNFGRMVSIRMVGTNGAEYHGRASWDGGNVIGLRRVKQ